MNKAKAINLIMERAESGERLDSLGVACAVARDLRTDDVQRWADRVQGIIADCERLRAAERSTKPADPDALEQESLRAEMAKLQARLDALEHSTADRSGEIPVSAVPK